MEVNLIKLVSESKSVIDLETKLAEAGYKFPTYKNYVKWLRREWSKIGEERMIQMEVHPTELVFPTTEVRSEDVDYQLHGVCHGQQIYVQPGWHMRRNVRDFISERMASFHKPEDGEDYLYEENFNNILDLLQSQEIRDQTKARRQPSLKDFALGILLLPIAVSSIFLWPPSSFLAYCIVNRIVDPTRGRDHRDLYLLFQSLKDERYQNKFTEFSIAKEMPQPFNLEIEYLRQIRSTGKRIVDSCYLNPYAGTATERSLLISKDLRSYAKEKGLRRLHLLCGANHVTETAYFLQHPDYSFDSLEEYRQSRRG